MLGGEVNTGTEWSFIARFLRSSKLPTPEEGFVPFLPWFACAIVAPELLRLAEGSTIGSVGSDRVLDGPPDTLVRPFSLVLAEGFDPDEPHNHSFQLEFPP